MRTKKQKFLLFIKIFMGFLVLSFCTVFFFREVLLQKAMVHLQQKIKHDYDSRFTFKSAKFDGIAGVELQNLVLVPKNGETLFQIENVKIALNVWHLLIGTIQVNRLEAQNGFVNLVKNKNGRNFDAFLPKKKDTTASIEKINYCDLTYKIVTKTLRLIPTELYLKNLSLQIDDLGKKTHLQLKTLHIIDKQLESYLQIHTNTCNQRWKIKGFADPRNRQTDISFFNIDTGKIKVPYLEERFNLKSSFDSIHLNVSNIAMDGDKLHIDGFASLSNFTIHHPKIAKKEVVINKARFDYHLLFSEHYIAVDSSSTIQLNKMLLRPYASYNNETAKIYDLKITIPKMKAQDFIGSLPKGLFTHFEGMEVAGNFDYQLHFIYNKSKPNATIFESKINKENLKILRYGEANLMKLNGDFVYHAIINNIPQRGILVGLANPNYAQLSTISPYLRKAVLTTEDPSFFSHKGFITEAFKQSIVKNIKTNAFSRGGSTISMQLIKNAFLTREKTLSRKLEEILLVYILENNHIVSKERMLEVYFNIIEWGPNVYGIGEAAAFYFQKNPSQLTLNECLFLATTIPSPKKFMYQFNNLGFLKKGALNRDKQLIKLMLRRGILITEDTVAKTPILVTGAAKNFIKIKEENTEEIDSTALEELEF